MMLVLILIVIPSLLLFWTVRLVKLYRRGKSKRTLFVIEGLVFSTIIGVALWNLGVFPMSKQLYIKKVSEEITGNSFWSSKEFSFDEISIRGEGYSIDVYKFNDEVADYFKSPDQDFFESYPQELKYRNTWKREKWKRTPVTEIDQVHLTTATPTYANWNQNKMERMNSVRNLANNSGGFYAFNTKNGDVDFFIIAPKEKLFVMINHNL